MKTEFQRKIPGLFNTSTFIMYFFAHYSVHIRESIFYHAPRIYGTISTTVEANTSGKNNFVNGFLCTS